MTKEQQDAVKADFVEWSGGFTPNECSPEELHVYLDLACCVDLPKDEVEAFLLTWAEEADKGVEDRSANCWKQ